MGNFRFRLSDMMPNAWFYKLRDMSRKHHHHNNSSQPHHTNNRRLYLTTTPTPTKSHNSHSQQRTHHNYYYPYPTTASTIINKSPTNPKKLSHTQFPPLDPPRKSSKKKTHNRKSIYKSSASITSNSSCICRHDSNPKPTIPAHVYYSVSPPCSCRVTSSTTDIIINMHENSSTRKFDTSFELDAAFSELDLPPILTKPSKKTTTNSTDSFKLDKISRNRKPASYSTGMKLRANSPRIQATGRKSVSSTCSSKSRRRRMGTYAESVAIVKSSFDPQKDFKDSMREMIVENNIRASKELEELLACYLSLNSEQYHDAIVGAFEQIWFDTADIKI